MLAQRARRDAERELREPRGGADLPAHGTEVGYIEYALHGQIVRARLLATGHHCRSYGVEIDGRIVGIMGADRAWAEYVRPSVRPMASTRTCG
jgi:hypothetical protein